jgi:hypothetical protein
LLCDIFAKVWLNDECLISTTSIDVQLALITSLVALLQSVEVGWSCGDKRNKVSRMKRFITDSYDMMFEYNVYGVESKSHRTFGEIIGTSQADSYI